MSEMVERVARAMCDRVNGEGDYDENIAARRAGWMGQARAAIEAMREPSEAQIDRFVSRALCVSVHGEGGWSVYARGQWQAMIDAALADSAK